MSEHLDRFLKAYAEIQAFLLSDMETKLELDSHRRAYLKKMMDVTCLGGKYNRGLTVVVIAAAMLADKGVDVLETGLHDACVCGWMIEFMQAHYLVEDDIMDNGELRRGGPCWYRHPGVTTQSAINDGLILKGWALRMAEHYFGTKPFYLQVLREFEDVYYTTSIGQLYDVTSQYDARLLIPDAPKPPKDYVEFTLAHYQRIVKYKTAFYTYYLPLMMGVLVCRAEEQVDLARLRSVALLMGEYFQVQDDVQDCYAPPEKLGKVGRDIEEQKCSWLAVTFLQRATKEQIELFKANYGIEDPAKVKKVKELYEESQLLAAFSTYEEGVAKQVEEHIQALQAGSSAFANCVRELWSRTYRRSK